MSSSAAGPLRTDSPPPLSLSFKHSIHLEADLVQKISLTFAEPGGLRAQARQRAPPGRGGSFAYESERAQPACQRSELAAGCEDAAGFVLGNVLRAFLSRSFFYFEERPVKTSETISKCLIEDTNH